MSSVRPMGKQCRQHNQPHRTIERHPWFHRQRAGPDQPYDEGHPAAHADADHTALLVIRPFSKPVRGKLHPIEDRRSVGRPRHGETYRQCHGRRHPRSVDGDRHRRMASRGGIRHRDHERSKQTTACHSVVPCDSHRFGDRSLENRGECDRTGDRQPLVGRQHHQRRSQQAHRRT